MNDRARVFATTIAATCLFLAPGSPLQVPARGILQKGTAVTTHATGSFDVQLNPQAPQDKAAGITLARMAIDKQYHGDLEGTSKGEMLTAAADSSGSAAYVAIERVVGALHGRTGSFALMHNGTMTREAQHLTVTVVPGSGTGQLTGLAGTMTIRIADKKHFYDLEYTLTPP